MTRLITLNEIKQKFLKRWRQESFEFPLSLHDKFPNSKIYDKEKLYENPEFKQWLETLKQDCQKAGLQLHLQLFSEKRFSVILPTQLLCPDFQSFIKFLGVEKEHQHFKDLESTTKKVFPEILPYVLSNRFKLLKTDLQTWWKILFYTKHIVKTAELGSVSVSVRDMMSLPEHLTTMGIDSKFYDSHQTIIDNLISFYQERSNISVEFKRTSPLIRYRPLSNGIMQAKEMGVELPYELLDTARPVEIFKQFSPNLKAVIIVENLNTYLSLPSIPDMLAIFGSGYQVAILKDVEWLKHTPIYYWGDLDCAGFQILNKVRQLFPHTKSIFMDNETFENHKQHCVYYESKNYGELTELTESEQQLYQVLKTKTEKGFIRLEQEFISANNIKNYLTFN